MITLGSFIVHVMITEELLLQVDVGATHNQITQQRNERKYLLYVHLSSSDHNSNTTAYKSSNLSNTIKRQQY